MLRHATWSKPPISVEVRTSSRLLLVVLQAAMLPLRGRLLPGARPSRLVMTLGMLLLLLLVRSLLVFVHMLVGMFPSRAKYIERRQTGTDGSLCVVADSLAIAKGGRLRLPAMAVTRTCSRRCGSVDGGCRPPARFGRGLNVLNAPEGSPSRLVMALGMLLLLLLVMLMVIAPDRLLHLRSLLVFVHVLAGMFPSRAKNIGRRQTGTDGSLCVVAHSLAIAKGGRLRLPAMAVTRTCSRRCGSVDGGCRPPARFGRGLNVLNAPEGRQDSRIVYTLFLCFSKCEHLGTELVLTGKVRCFA